MPPGKSIFKNWRATLNNVLMNISKASKRLHFLVMISKDFENSGKGNFGKQSRRHEIHAR